jgi:hypothetical protein
MNEQGEKELLEVIARLDTIERQNQQILAMLAKLTGEHVAPGGEGGISPARRMEISQMAYEAVRSPPRRKKKSPSKPKV